MLIEAVSKTSDEDLVRAAQVSDDQAFEELMRRHRSACMKIAISILRNQDSAEDEVQNGFWKAYQHLNRFQFESQFSTWLNRIVINQCLMRIRSDRRRSLLYIDDVRAGDENTALELRDERANPEQALGADQVHSALRREIRRIPPLLRVVLELKDLEERSVNDVAGMLGLTVAAVKSRLLRARRLLRSRMQLHTGRLGEATLLAGHEG